ncbi:MAG: InlB B-repeat-containing protein, partial [Syntrophobacteraceae bacterium]
MGRYIGYVTTILIISLTLFATPSRGATTQAVLAWNASTDSSVIGYNVYVGTQSGNYQTPINAGNNTTYTVTGLSDSQTYYFAVTAYSSSQESPYSQELVCDFITAGTASNGQITPAGTTAVAGGGAQTYSIVPDSGYQIGTVTVDGQQLANPTSSYTFSSVSGCHTIAATFVPSAYTITASSQAGGTISPSGAVSVNAGASQTFTISPSANYQISDVQVDGASVGAVSSYTFSNVTANHTISASFTPVQYSITASVQGSGGTISPSGTSSVSYGSSATYTITPATGYQISGVVVDGASAGTVSSYTFTNVTANHTITATFTAVQYSITASVQGSGGTISPSGTSSVSYGSSATYTITPATGYQISGVVVDGASAGTVSSYTFSNVTANHTITASFTAVQYTISASVQGSGGTISPSGTSSVSYGSSATYTITPATGYKISSVTVDGTSAGAVSSYT